MGHETVCTGCTVDFLGSLLALSGGIGADGGSFAALAWAMKLNGFTNRGRVYVLL